MAQLEKQEKLSLYFFDESGFALNSSIPYCWSPEREPIEIPANSHSKRLNILGFINKNNELFYRSKQGKVDTDTVLDVFDEWIEQISGDKPVFVILDNASIHRSKKFMSRLPLWQEKQVYLCFLPPYCPELNLIEMLWKKVKYEWLPPSAYESFEKLIQGVTEILDTVGSHYKITFT